MNSAGRKGMVESGQAMIPAYESVVIRERQRGRSSRLRFKPSRTEKNEVIRRVNAWSSLYEICSSRVLGEVLGKLFR